MIAKKIADIWNPSGQALAAISGKQPDKSGRIPFYPFCGNKNKPECLIGKQPRPCANCPDKDRRAVDTDMITKNMNGQQEWLGIYPLMQDNTTAWVAGDFDAHNEKQDPSADIKKIIAFMVEINQYHNIPFYLFSSKSGNGYHLYIFSDKPVLAGKFRLLYNEIVKRADVGLSFDSVYPKQDEARGLDIGNLIAMPFHGQSFQKKGSCWLDTGNFNVMGSSPKENAEWFAEEFEAITETEIDNILKEWGVKYSGNGSKSTGAYVSSGIHKDNKLADIISNCDFLSHCRDNAGSLAEPQWFMMIQVLAREYGGPAIIHEMSKEYPGYSPQHTDAKILEVLNRQPGPLTCRHIKTCDNKFECGKDCGVSTPVHLSSSTQNRKNQQDIEWVSEVLIGVRQGERTRTAQRLAGFWLKQFDGDTDKTVNALLEWNARNIPPLEQAVIIATAGQAEQRIGLEQFGNATGITIVHSERQEYPDGSVVYQIYTEENKPWPFSIQQIVSKNKFQIRVVEISNFMPPVPSGPGSTDIWREIVNHLFRDTVISIMPEEETPNSVIRHMINKDIEMFLKSSESEKYDYDMGIKRGVIIHKEKILVKLTAVMSKTKYHDELKKKDRKEIAKIMRDIGFVYNKTTQNVKGIRAKFWQIHKDDFYEEE